MQQCVGNSNINISGDSTNGLPPCAPNLAVLRTLGLIVSRSRGDSSALINFPFVQGCVRMIQHASANCPEFHPQVNWRTTSLEFSSSARHFRISFGQGTGNGLDRASVGCCLGGFDPFDRLWIGCPVPTSRKSAGTWHLMAGGWWLDAGTDIWNSKPKAESQATS